MDLIPRSVKQLTKGGRGNDFGHALMQLGIGGSVGTIDGPKHVGASLTQFRNLFIAPSKPLERRIYMPVIGDFIRIIGDSDERIGDGAQPRKFEFNTGGRHAPATAYIIMMVKGMTATTNQAEVHLNNKLVGFIFNNNGGRINEWQTQIVHCSGSDLNNGNNQLELRGVTYPGGGDDHFDDYFVRNVICHFHQDV